MHNLARPWRPLFAVLSLSFLSASCSVKFISDYDEVLDRSITEFQHKAETLLTTLEQQKPIPKYAAYQREYVALKADISSMTMRAKAFDKNEITVKQLENLMKLVSDWEAAHQQGLMAEEIPAIRAPLNVACTAILKLEIAKKRGKD